MKLEKWDHVADMLDGLLETVRSGLPSISRADPMAESKIAMAALLAKAHIDFRAMLLLNRNGASDPARVLARVVIESCFTILYISSDPATRGPEFWVYELQQRIDLGGKAHDLKAIPEEGLKQLEEWKKALAIYSSASKKGRVRWPSLFDMIDALANQLGAVNRSYYDAVVKEYDYVVHALPLHLVNGFVRYGQGTVTVKDYVRPVDPVYSLMATCPIVYAVTEKASRIFDLDTQDELLSIQATIEAMDEP